MRPLINPQAVYIKDCSFEAPTGPFMGGAEGSPTVNLNLATRANALAQDMHEVVLQVNLEAKVGDKTVWLLELQQAGAFMIRNLSTNDLGQVLSIVAPNYLLSFRARDHCRAGHQGRLPAVPAAARDVRGPARPRGRPAAGSEPVGQLTRSPAWRHRTRTQAP